MHRLFSTVAVAALLSAACSTAPTEIATLRNETGTPEGDALPVTRLRAEPYSFAYYSGMMDSVRLAVRDAGQWQQVWSAIEHGSSPGTAAPQVDFTREMVLVAALGTRNSGGFSIYVDSAYQRSDHVEVVIRKVSPGKQCGVTGALTQPVDLARIPASTQPVRFRERSLVHDCG
jgi:PrcB C-terminal